MVRRYHLERFSEDCATDDFVKTFIEQIWESVSNNIQEKWLASIEVPVAADVAMSKLQNIVAWATLQHDGDFKPAISFEHKIPDIELKPIATDPWARGVVPVRKVERQDDDSGYKRSPTGSDGTLSVSGASGISSSDRSSTKGSSRSRFTAGSRKGPNSPGKSTKDFSGIIELEDDERTMGPFRTGGNLYEIYQRTEKQKKHQESAEVKDEFSLLQEEIDKMTKDLKGKKFTLDVDGKPIPISTVEPERLPPFAYQLGLSITSGSNDVIAKPKDSIPRRKRVKLRVAGSRGLDEAFFVSSASLATSLSSTQIVLNPGVSLRTDNTVREGPPAPEDPNRPSRKAFLKSRASGTRASVFGGGGSAATSATLLGTYSADMMTGSPNDNHSAFGLANSSPIGGVSGPATNMSGAGASKPGTTGANTRSPPANLMSTGSLGVTGRFVDIDPTEGGRKHVAKAEQPSPTDDSEYGLGPVVTLGKPHPAKLPLKPTVTQGKVVKQLFGGVEKTGPRDREPPIAQVAASHRKRGPPPPAGQLQLPRDSKRSSNHPMLGSMVSEDSISFSTTAPASLGEGYIKTEPILKQVFK